MKYFNWRTLGIIRHQLGVVLNELIKFNFSPFIHGNYINYSAVDNHLKHFNLLTAYIYKVYVCSFADYLLSYDNLHLLTKLKEPHVGNPFTIHYNDMLLSQDLCNSIHEYYSIYAHSNSLKHKKLAELGAGYGRLVYCFLKTVPSMSYCIIDIPPALFIAQKYLSNLFPNDDIFFFRPFKSFSSVKKQFTRSRISFIMPQQMSLIPDNYFDIFINISSLHEMSRDRINNYLKQIDRLTKGLFYSKQWRRSRVIDNQYIKENEYMIPSNWRLVFKRSPHPIQQMFFDALYQTRTTV